MTRKANPITPFLDQQGALILDGGLATELEARGEDIADELWSAGVLASNPDLVRQVHLDYLHAGADCVISATYQATEDGFMAARGLDAGAARSLILRAVELAVEARERFWNEPDHRRGRLRPLVAASVGPYGAYLADGSEYTGAYDLDEEGLAHFHRQRFRLLADAGADLLACETIPSLPEARVLVRLLAECPSTRAWFSFCCRDGGHLADGTPIEVAAAAVQGCGQVVAVGVNCTPPRFIASLLARLRRDAGPFVVYPNAGLYDARTKTWSDDVFAPDPLADDAAAWFAAGARLLGGCCRTGPRHVREIRRRLVGRGGDDLRQASSQAGIDEPQPQVPAV
jgi:homocysteine S-methyltransferase